MESMMFYLCILFFCQVSIQTVSKYPQILPCKLHQVLICCFNPGIGYCLSNKLRCILVEDNYHVLHILIVTQTELFLQYQIQALLLSNCSLRIQIKKG
jgi:hypothetical protein